MFSVPLSFDRLQASSGFSRYATPVVVAGAAAVAALVLLTAAPDLGDWRLWMFGGLVLLGELYPVDVPRRDGLDRVTTSTAFGFATLLLFGPLAAVLVYGGASLVADATARLAPLKALFNAAQYVLALVAAAGVMAWIGTDLPVSQLAGRLPAVAAGAVTFLAVNHVLAAHAVAPSRRLARR